MYKNPFPYSWDVGW